jgi:hypothetical protein
VKLNTKGLEQEEIVRYQKAIQTRFRVRGEYIGSFPDAAKVTEGPQKGTR